MCIIYTGKFSICVEKSMIVWKCFVLLSRLFYCYIMYITSKFLVYKVDFLAHFVLSYTW